MSSLLVGAALGAAGGAIAAALFTRRTPSAPEVDPSELRQQAAGLAHDLNNVLVTLGGGLDALREHDAGGEAPAPGLARFERALGDACALSARLAALATGETAEPEPIDLAAIVTACAEDLEPARPGSLSLELQLSAALPQLVADPAAMRRLVQNLLLNAYEACAADGGAVRLSARAIGGGEELLLEVADDGPGMEREVAAKATRAGFSTKGRGRGHGLAIVRDAAASAGGALDLWSRPGVGTRVRVVLPSG